MTSAFALLAGIPVGITSSPIGSKSYGLTEVIKKYKSIIKKIRKKLAKITLLAKTRLNNVEVLISKIIIDSDISHNK